MSDDDDIEKLLAEINGGPGRSKPSKDVAVRGSDATESPGRTVRALRTGLVSGVVCGAGVGAATFLLQWLPLIDNPWSSGAGAFIGAFLTGATLSATRKG
jgi:hypothetical protein